MQVLHICLKVTDFMQRWFNPFSPCDIQSYSAVSCQRPAGVRQKYGFFSTWTTSSWRWGGRSRGGICICFFKKCYALGIYICKEERRFSTLRSFDPSLGFNLSYLISKHLCGLWHTHLSSRRFSVPPSKPSWKLLFWITAAQYITPGYSSDRARSRNISDSHCSFCNAEWP